MLVRIIGVLAEIQTCHLPNTNQNCYHLDFSVENAVRVQQPSALVWVDIRK